MEHDRAHPAGGHELGYARVSTSKQNLERQLNALAETGLPEERIYVDKETDTTVDRPGRSLREVLNLIHDPNDKKIGAPSPPNAPPTPALSPKPTTVT